MSTQVVKAGWIQRFSKSLLGGGWKQVYVKLYSDSNFFWFKSDHDPTSSGNVRLKDVRDFLAIGSYVRAIPYSPDLPPGANVDHMIAFPQEPRRKSKVFFFLCNNQTELTSWMNGISSTLPSNPQPVPGYAAASATVPPTTQPAPPPVAPGYHPESQRPGCGPPGFGAVAANPPPYSTYGPGGFPPPGGGAAAPPQPPHQPYPPQAQPAYPAQGYGGAQYPPVAPASQYGAYPTQPAAYPQQAQPAAYPPQGYPQQGYPQQGYPHQGYPQQQPVHGHQYPAHGGYQQGYTSQSQTVIMKQKKSKGKGYGKMAAGLAGGALAGYAASRMIGGFGGWGGGMGWGGSWSSGSFSGGSFGSCGSFGSFGGSD